MEIMKVRSDLVVTRRHPGLENISLRVLQDSKGGLSVAVDPVGASDGTWVITASGSAARVALLDKKSIVTDLTILGIIDNWE
jgi:carboxysome peptide B